MKLIARTALIVMSVVAFVAAQPSTIARAALSSVEGQDRPPSTAEALHFHHVHLNSMNPAAAAEYYPKPFTKSATKTTFNGLEAVKTGNIYILFTKVNTPPTN